MPMHPVPTTEARRDLNKTLKRFRAEGPAADPVVFGSHRRAEAVILAYEQYDLLRELVEDLAIAAEVRDRDARDTGERVDVDALAAELGIDLGG